MVWVTGFEPATSASRTLRATRLRYTQIKIIISYDIIKSIMRYKKRNRKVLLPILCLLMGVLVYVGISVIVADIRQEYVTTFELRGATRIDSLVDLSDSRYAVAIDGEVVYANNNEIYPTASTAKMILGLAVMREKPFNLGETGEIFTISDLDYEIYSNYRVHDGASTAVQVGEEISEYDALVSVFLPSSNNMADSLAIWVFGSLDGYREYATKMLRDWGIEQIMIGDDAGGFSATTVGTVADLAKIGKKVLEEPVLAAIVGMETASVPVAGVVHNTNQLLGESGIVGVKTGFIGDASGYCLVSGYKEGEHIVTVALTGADTRGDSFAQSLSIVNAIQKALKETNLIKAGDIVGYYESWWAGKTPIIAKEDFGAIVWQDRTANIWLEMDETTGVLKVEFDANTYQIVVEAPNYIKSPSFWQRIKHAFGWRNNAEIEITEVEKTEDVQDGDKDSVDKIERQEDFTNAKSSNCTVAFGKLMLVNANYPVENDFIAARRGELISLSANYGIRELNGWNGDNLLDAEAAKHLAMMLQDYKDAHPGHEMGTLSCFRAVGTTCGRLCAATGTSDHHTGLTCDLADPAYGTALDTDYLSWHPEWQWLKANSYKYGFIDRYPEHWAGGSMYEPLNVDENGSTGFFETWHYRYVGVTAATEIATGKYNNGEYDSLEHYLKARGGLADLKNGTCQ